MPKPPPLPPPLPPQIPPINTQQAPQSPPSGSASGSFFGTFFGVLAALAVVAAGMLLACGGCLLLGTAALDNAAKSVQENQPGDPASTLTMAKFNQIRTGMKPDEVFAILGNDGELLSENKVGAGTKYATDTRLYMWRGSGFGQSCTVMFQNGKVMQKSQFGLK